MVNKGDVVFAPATLACDAETAPYGVVYEWDQYEDDWYDPGARFVVLDVLHSGAFPNPFFVMVAPDGRIVVGESVHFFLLEPRS